MLFGKTRQENYTCPQCKGLVSEKDLVCPKCGADLERFIDVVKNPNSTEKIELLGSLYLFGTYVPQDYSKALLYLTKAANAGSASAQYNIGIMYNQGEGVAIDYNKAFYWFRKAAEAGHHMAQGNVGTAYLSGRGTEENNIRGLYWLNKGRENGDEFSARVLADMGIGEMIFLDEDSMISFQKIR